MIATKDTVSEAVIDMFGPLDYGTEAELRVACQRIRDARVASGFAIYELPSNDQIDTLMTILGAKVDGENYATNRDAIRALILNLRVKQPTYDMEIPDMAKMNLSYLAYMGVIKKCEVTPPENKEIIGFVLRDFLMFTSHQMAMKYKEKLDESAERQ